MSTFKSNRYPSLLVKFADGTKVQFENGEAEVSGEVAKRLTTFAENRPDLDIEAGEAEKSETPKQRLQREARERGLDDSGTVAEIEARIAEHDADDDQDGDDDTDDDEHEDDSEE